MQEKTLAESENLPEPVTFSDRLGAIMAQRKISQSELARLVGTRQSTVRGWLSGSVPRPRTVTEIAEAINVSVIWLAHGKGPPDPGGEPMSSPKVAEETVPYLPRKGPDPSSSIETLTGLINDLVDVAPPEKLAEVVKALAGKIARGDDQALREADVLMRLIRERRPGVFDSQKPLDR